MTEEEKYKLELVYKKDMKGIKRFWIDELPAKTCKVYPLRNDLKNFIERIPDTEEVVGIVYDGSFTLEILTAEKKNNV